MVCVTLHIIVTLVGVPAFNVSWEAIIGASSLGRKGRDISFKEV